MAFQSTDPTTGASLRTYPTLTPDEVWAALDRCHRAQLAWSSVPVRERVAPLKELAAALRGGRKDLARTMTSEMGKPIAQAIAEVDKCALACDYYAEWAEEQLAPVSATTDATVSYWTYRPLGVVLGIMPWNFPFWQVVRFAVPTLTAGNGALLKHAPNVPECADRLEKLFADAGYPKALFANLYADLDTTGALIDHPRVRGVSVTGSVRAGRAVAERAGRGLKKCVLELGGSDPSLVLEDADLDLAASSCVQGRLLNTGQSCIAAKRFVVVDAVREDFQSRVVERMEAAKVGDPGEAGTELGPMARRDLRDDLHDQVRRSIDAGAELVLGGEVPARDGWWYPATVLAGVAPGMPAYEEELFGPVASVLAARDEEDAIRIANDTSYGLGASVYTQDAARGERIAAERLEAGNCFVNGIVKSDPRLPFGGVKDSGFGRELSPLGILEFTNAKTVWVR